MLDDFPPFQIALISLFNLCWIATYILVIRRAHKDKAFGMPVIGLMANFAFDIVFSVILPAPFPQILINLAYVGFGLAMGYQAWLYWRADFANLSNKQFYSMMVGAFLFFIGLFIVITFEFDNKEDGMFAGYVNVLVTSCLFVAMILRRQNVKGQSLYIAMMKWVGTAVLSLSLYIHPFPDLDGSILMHYLYIAIFIIDFIYVILVYQYSRAQNIEPWRRF